MMLELRAVGGAFLVAVLICDLTFDLPVWLSTHGDSTERDRALQVMTEYYRRITAKGSPLSRSVAMVMIGILASLLHDLVSAPTKGGLLHFVVETSLVVGPITLAGLRTFPRARRFAAGGGDVVTRIDLAGSIARDHALALPAMLAYVVFQLAQR